VTLHDGLSALDAAHAASQVGGQFLQRAELILRGKVAIQVADEANAEGDVIQVITRHVTTIDLARPTAANLDLAISR